MLDDLRNVQLFWQVPLFVLSQISAMLQGLWRYWARGSVGARWTIMALAVVSVCLFVTGLALPASRPWSMLGALALGPVVIVFHMTWTSLEYQGPPQSFQPLPRVLDRLDNLVTWLGEKSNLGAAGIGRIPHPDPDPPSSCSEASTLYEASIVVEDDPPVTADGRLAESVGLETGRGAFTPLLAAGSDLPCEVAETLGTAQDKQDEIRISLFRGTSSRAIGNHFLGEFAIGGIPETVREKPSICVTVRASYGAIVLRAHGPLGSYLTIERRA